MVDSTLSEALSGLDWFAVLSTLIFSVFFLCHGSCLICFGSENANDTWKGHYWTYLIWQCMSRMWQFWLFILTINIPRLVKCGNWQGIWFYLMALTLFCQLGLGIETWKLLSLLLEYCKFFMYDCVKHNKQFHFVQHVLFILIICYIPRWISHM